jgi:hypothetical protein
MWTEGDTDDIRRAVNEATAQLRGARLLALARGRPRTDAEARLSLELGRLEAEVASLRDALRPAAASHAMDRDGV